MKRTIFLLTLLCTVAYSVPSLAQVQKVLYQYLQVNDSSNSIRLDIKDNYEIIPWHHENRIMIETTVVLENGSMDLLSTLIREGRYNFTIDSKNALVSMVKPVQENRYVLKNKGVQYKENILVKVYIPDIFEKKSSVEYARTSESIIATKEEGNK